MLYSSPAAILLTLAAAFLPQPAEAHGMVVSHWIREAGAKSGEVCGEAFNADREGRIDGNTKYGPISPMSPAGQPWADQEKCNWRLCAGYQYEDNKENTYTYPTDSIIPISVFILNRHGGVANVSIVDTATNKVIGSELKSWDKDYGKYDHVNTCPNGPPQEQTDFNITMPDLGDQCTEGGKCVIQWYWYSEAANNQTFNSCIDFVQPFGGSAPASPVKAAPNPDEHHRYCNPPEVTANVLYNTATWPQLAGATNISDIAAPTATNTPAPTSSIAASTSASGSSDTTAPIQTVATDAESSAAAGQPTESASSSSIDEVALAAAPTMTTVEASPVAEGEEGKSAAATVTTSTASTLVKTTSPEETNEESTSTDMDCSTENEVEQTSDESSEDDTTTTTTAAVVDATPAVAMTMTVTATETVYVMVQPIATSTLAPGSTNTPSSDAISWSAAATMSKKRHVGRKRLLSSHW